MFAKSAGTTGVSGARQLAWAAMRGWTVVLVVLPVAAGLVAAPTTLGKPAHPAQAGPEYGIIVSGVAGGLQKATKPVYTCTGANLSGITEALQGAQAVRNRSEERR